MLAFFVISYELTLYIYIGITYTRTYTHAHTHTYILRFITTYIPVAVLSTESHNPMSKLILMKKYSLNKNVSNIICFNDEFYLICTLQVFLVEQSTYNIQTVRSNCLYERQSCVPF